MPKIWRQQTDSIINGSHRREATATSRTVLQSVSRHSVSPREPATDPKQTFRINLSPDDSLDPRYVWTWRV
ncbi:unnamed protein product [Bursaphelenchus okinawaensis]|uniref:Uncharacterized protein n=1 Tax=Bursaphelenchus okinawaensis TaxID=465554 RepID=A0A811KX40_9BILA|nr:unnamed protein product [Bursaphelenchus okinawaensis]CAG9113237.1 unnamed protein product [Bursaphelenchus okinawaensis]